MDDERYQGVIASAGARAAEIMEALELPEVREALEAWSDASFNAIRAFERGGLARHVIAGMLGGGIIDVIQQMTDEEAAE